MSSYQSHDTAGVKGGAAQQQCIGLGMSPGDGGEPTLAVNARKPLQALVCDAAWNDEQRGKRATDSEAMIDYRYSGQLGQLRCLEELGVVRCHVEKAET